MKRIVCILVVVTLLFQTLFMNAFASGVIKGDVNGDGEISLQDARMVLNYVARLAPLTEEALLTADYDEDGIITLEDARNILLLAVDLPPEYIGMQYFEQLTPFKSNDGIKTKSKFCVIKGINAETLPATPLDNKSNPIYSPFLEGTYDYVTSGPVKHEGSGQEFYILKSGRRVYKDAVRVFTGYDMPLNKIELVENKVESFNGSTKFYLKLDWRVPFNVTVKPQEYETGYNSRAFNIADGKFTGSYMDITFYYTQTAEGEITFPESDRLKSMKWIINEEKNLATLRLYLKNAGDFGGYNVSYDENNYLVVSVKEPSYALNDRVIMIDPGHGGEQPGAGSGTGVYERDVTYKISLELKALLEQGGAVVLFSRDDSEVVPEIEERREDTYILNPDMFISIHCDSSDSKSAKGSSVYYYKNYSGPLAYKIAKALPTAVKNSTGYAMTNKGAHFYPFLVTRIECCPSVLVECGFISNASDFKIINSKNGQKAIAKGIYEGILDYYNY